MQYECKEQEQTICYCIKHNIDNSFSSICPGIDKELCHNIVKVVCYSHMSTLTM